jgi:hypothetical protein
MTAPPPAALRGLVSRLMHEDFARTQMLWVEGHLRLLAQLRQVVGNDLDKILILAVIGQRMLGDPLFRGQHYDPGGGTTSAINRQRLTNIGSVAAATGIPRESVRRKVNELAKADWVVRDPGGQLSVGGRAAVELNGTTQTTIDLLDALFSQFAGDMVARGWIAVEKRPDA